MYLYNIQNFSAQIINNCFADFCILLNTSERNLHFYVTGNIKNVTYNSKTMSTNRTLIDENIIPTIHNERIEVTEANGIPQDKDSYLR